MLSVSPCEIIGKWETCPILRDRSLLRFKLEHLRQKLPVTLLDVSKKTVCNVASAYVNLGRQQLRGGKRQKGIVAH
jgi:hypothetical protein